MTMKSQNSLPILMIVSRWIAALLLSAAAACEIDGGPGPEPAELCPADAVRAVVMDFGERLQRVSTAAPDSLVRRAVRAAYATVVTAALLEKWITDPASAPGRDVSSPWPDRIEVRQVRSADRACAVSGDVVYVTSAETGTAAAAAREHVTLRVVQEDGAWRIAAYDAN